MGCGPLRFRRGGHYVAPCRNGRRPEDECRRRSGRAHENTQTHRQADGGARVGTRSALQGMARNTHIRSSCSRLRELATGPVSLGDCRAFRPPYRHGASSQKHTRLSATMPLSESSRWIPPGRYVGCRAGTQSELGALTNPVLRNAERPAQRTGRHGNRWWPETDLNRRHGDFQSPALPTELPGRYECAAYGNDPLRGGQTDSRPPILERRRRARSYRPRYLLWPVGTFTIGTSRANGAELGTRGRLGRRSTCGRNARRRGFHQRSDTAPFQEHAGLAAR